MKLEAGKYYKTRNGQKAKCVAVWTDEYKGYQTSVMLPEWELPVHYSLSGKFYADENGSDEDDIVSEWQTESRPFRAGDVTTIQDGRNARILCVDFKDKCLPIVAAVEWLDGLEIVLYFTAEGHNSGGHILTQLYDEEETL